MSVTPRALVLLLPLVVGVVACGGTQAPQPAPAVEETSTAPEVPPRVDTPQVTSTVQVRVFRFMPDSLSVPVGTTVTWNNEDAGPHTVTAGTPAAPTGLFDMRLSGQGAEGSSVTFTFDEPGTYAYFCNIHPSMLAEIRVS